MKLRADRIWMIAGVLGALGLFAAGYLLVISPQRSQTTELRDQVAANQLDLASLRHRLVDLEEQNDNLDQYKAQLLRGQKALPAVPALSDFLRELQTAGDSSGVQVTGLVVGAPTETTTGGARIIALPIT